MLHRGGSPPNHARRAAMFSVATALWPLVLPVLWAMLAPGAVGAADPPAAETIDFFESRIRPVLVEHCYQCHNSVDTAEAELALDFRDGLRKASQRGVIVVPGQPDKSLLLKVIRHQIPDVEMPEGGPQLDESVIADFETWIRLGAADPRDAPPSVEELAQATSWEAILEKRKHWWSLQPIREPQVPVVDKDWSDHPIDQFILARLQANELEPSAQADRRTLLRRLSFVLTGLPPTPAQVRRFVTDQDADAYKQLVDRLIDSKQFGERWARHWMDLVRYADSHGSEGDPTIPHAYRYRDYLIRALNTDVPYDQLLREHVAGDLLPDPRINHDLGINESAIGTAHWRMVFHGFAPTDALDEKVRFTDDEINVFSKAFLAMTVSCARCHDHKFDPISQKDYYALFGILGSCRPALLDVNTADRQQMHQQRLAELKAELRDTIASSWAMDYQAIGNQLLAPREVARDEKGNGKENRGGKQAGRTDRMRSFWAEIKKQRKEGRSFESIWRERVNQWNEEQRKLKNEPVQDDAWRWNFAKAEDYRQWFSFGNGLAASTAGEFAVASSGHTVLDGIFPAGVFTHRLSTKHRGFFASPRIQLNDDYQVWFHIAGGGQATVRYAVQNYPRSGTVYPIPEIKQADWYWQKLSLDYWNGDHVHFELATARDAPLQVRNKDRSWFGVRQVVVRKSSANAPA